MGFDRRLRLLRKLRRLDRSVFARAGPVPRRHRRDGLTGIAMPALHDGFVPIRKLRPLVAAHRHCSAITPRAAWYRACTAKETVPGVEASRAAACPIASPGRLLRECRDGRRSTTAVRSAVDTTKVKDEPWVEWLWLRAGRAASARRSHWASRKRDTPSSPITAATTKRRGNSTRRPESGSRNSTSATTRR